MGQVTDEELELSPSGNPTSNSGLIGDLAMLCHFIAFIVFFALVMTQLDRAVALPIYLLAPAASLVLGIIAVRRGGQDRSAGKAALIVLGITAFTALPFGYQLLVFLTGFDNWI